MTKALVIALLLVLAPIARSRAAAQDAIDLADVLEPLVAAAEAGLDADPALALARAELAAGVVGQGSWLHARAGSVAFRARAQLGAAAGAAPPLEVVLAPLLDDPGDGEIALARRRFVAVRAPRGTALAARVREPRVESVDPIAPAPPPPIAPAPPPTSAPWWGPPARETFSLLCPGTTRVERLRCRERELDHELLLIDSELEGTTHADDTAPAWMVGVGIPTALGSVAGLVLTIVSQGGSLIALPITTLVLGGASTIIGMVWLSRNGSPWRRRDAAARRLEQTRHQLSVSASGEGASVGLEIAF